MYDFLKQIPLFADLSDWDLGRLCLLMPEVHLPAGEVLFTEGSPGDKAYLIQEGELEVFKKTGNKELLLAVRKRGEVIGEFALLQDKPRTATLRALSDSTLRAIHREQLFHLIHTSPTAGATLFTTLLSRWQKSESLLRQSEKMVQLGNMTAGIAHELNNPAAAVKRGAMQLETGVNGMAGFFMQLAELQFTDAQRSVLHVFTDKTQAQAKHPPELDALTRSDQEDLLKVWLEQQNISDGWELAPTLVNMKLTKTDLGDLATTFSTKQLGSVLGWLNSNYETFNLMAELSQGAGRISDIVMAVKSYSYLDQGPAQQVDVHEGLDNTLLILRHKLKPGIDVRREYAADIPHIFGYGRELNQVWTNIMDNAADAVGEEGVIALRTHQDGDWVVVEIEDNGPGIPQDVQEKMFEPFFTTKPPGIGTGLGLGISYNIVAQKHRGEIKVFSKPGRTRFEVWLPVSV